MSKILKIKPITTGYRPIKDGSKYNSYFPVIKPKDRMIVGDKTADVDDVVELMKKVVWKYQADTEKIADLLKSDNLEKTITNIWTFLYHHIQYKLDTTGLEELRRPARLWHDKNGDCDDFAMTASSILTNLNIEHSFRITKYGKAYFQHVYIVVPHAKGHYVIDPVLSRANYEKPFTENKDFNMDLNGINVAVLEGIGNTDDDVMNDLLLTDLEGLGSISDEQADAKMYKYLVSTRKFAQKNKVGIAHFENPDNFIKSLDYAIKYWHTPQREKALAVLEANETKENDININRGLLSGFEDENEDEDWDEIDGLLDDEDVEQFLSQEEIDGFGLFRSRRKKRRAKRKARRAKRKVKRKKFWKKVKKGLKKVGKAIMRYNPANALIRGGILLVFRTGFPFKMFKQRLKWAFANNAQLKKARVSTAYRAKAQKVLHKIEVLFENIGGKKGNIKKAVLKGKKGRLDGLYDDFDYVEDELEGLGDGGISASAMVTAATALLKIISSIFKKNKLGKKEVKITKASTKSSMPEVSNGISPEQAEELISAGAEIITNSDGTKSVKKPVIKDGVTTYETVPISNRSNKAGFFSHIKNNPLMAFLGVGLLSGVAYMGYQAMSGKKPKGLPASKSHAISGHSTSKKSKKLKVEKLK